MTLALPPRPEPAQLAELCREIGGREAVQPDLVEKDVYLTRLLWALGQRFGDQLLLKGGTLLSKVDLGFFRMSEDADLVLSEKASHNKGSNMRRINQVRDALGEIEPISGAKRRFPGGDDSERGSHRRWDLDYPSEFGPQSIQLEVSLRPALRPTRRVSLGQLLQDPLLGDYRGAFCWALDPDEARAEKVRAAFTRDAIRDFYDLERFAEVGADLTSARFVDLVNAKLRELDAAPIHQQPRPLGVTAARRRALEQGLKMELPAVLRASAPPFDLARMLQRFERMW
ncbi:MAG TPA: nucleotidyl transferase AbiEii/AbiGii toxin family protein [Myxococcaceae bacterium]|nr:nucleotidyl transferase AbiEii/AbiGii toxin family protein [Myxococcaceae bacterium]